MMQRDCYQSDQIKSASLVAKYEKTKVSLARYLSYRDVPALLSKYVKGTKALDYGSGTGLSTHFLCTQGYEVVGVDVSVPMVEKAKINYPEIPFFLHQTEQLGFEPGTFDLVFSGSVLFEFETAQKILSYFKEAKRVLKQHGILLLITGSQHLYQKNWLVTDNKFPENLHLKSGDLGRLYTYDVDMDFFDYYWSEEDLVLLIDQAGFQILETHYPLGYDHEPYPWLDEKQFSPYVIFVLKSL